MKTVVFGTLVTRVREELESRDYSDSYIASAIQEWDRLDRWCSLEQRQNFSSETAFSYLDEYLGFHILPENQSPITLRKLRQIRLLTSFLDQGDFEFRSKKVEFRFHDEISAYVPEYLDRLRKSNAHAESTIDSRRRCLRDFSNYLDAYEKSIHELDVECLELFFEVSRKSQESRNILRYELKDFLSFLFHEGHVAKNLAGYVMKGSKTPLPQKVFTTYTENEIKDILSTCERGSAIGKRDYVVLLLAAQYGLRSGDIRTLRFSQIDWKKNSIELSQQKTGACLKLPLLASVGNAIIDYWRNGRPGCCVDDTIVVSHMQGTLGRPIVSSTIHSIVTAGMKRANIPNWKKKKHGAHSLRHSLATHMLRKNISMPIISTILGHRNTETTKVYIGIDIARLRNCSLPIPSIQSSSYRKREENPNGKD
jgi:site-specific recombinase XerD